MALIDKEQIRAEIKAQKSYAEGSYVPGDDNNYWYGKVVLCDELLAFIDSIPEQPVEGLDVTDFCKPIDPDIAQCVADHFWEMIGEESTNKKPVERLEEEYLRFVRSDHHQYQDLIGKGGIDLARHFYELGRQSRPKILDNSLEEEIAGMYQALFGTDVINRKEMLYLETFNAIARHFAEWGAEHLKK